jgi:hypothetical protein
MTGIAAALIACLRLPETPADSPTAPSATTAGVSLGTALHPAGARRFRRAEGEGPSTRGAVDAAP